jgi:hypothetical protein
MKRNLTKHLGLVLAVLLLGAGCGDDGDGKDDAVSADDQKAVAALASNLAPSGSSDIVRDQATCTAEKLVDAIGSEHLIKSGLLTADYVGKFGTKVDQTTAGAIADATVACFDARAQTVDLAPYYPKAGAEDYDMYVACVDGLDKELRTSVFEANVKNGKQSAQVVLNERVANCRKLLEKPR